MIFFLKFNDKGSFRKNHGKHEKTQIYQTCNNSIKKKLFSIRTELSYNNFFSENLLAKEMKRTQIFMNKPVYLSLSILEISKMVMYEL